MSYDDDRRAEKHARKEAERKERALEPKGENTIEVNRKLQSEELNKEYDSAVNMREELNMSIGRIREQWQAKMELHSMMAEGLRDQAVVHEAAAADIRDFLYPGDKDKIAVKGYDTEPPAGVI
jgi:hypothetical protein